MSNINRKLVILGTFVLLITVGLSGCNEQTGVDYDTTPKITSHLVSYRVTGNAERVSIYYTNYDIDINTGRTRTTKNLLFYQISNEVKDSILTETIGSFDDNVLPDWKNVSTVVPGAHYYPYPPFHGVFSQIHLVENLWQMFAFSDEAKKHMALCVLKEWQTNKNDYAAGDYIRKVSEIAYEKDKSEHGKLITVEDLEAIKEDIKVMFK